ncbi:MAG: hypothetical protein N3B16_09975 [Candidatus Aminicenantes bacterium]|nr:hypothetical protein [Candidatus Aminicenantes bacterium]
MFRLKIHLLGAEEVTKAISMKEAIEAVKEAFILVSQKKVVVPERTHLDLASHQGTSLIMPAYYPEKEKIGLKIINLYEKNPLFGLPHSYALMLIFDARNGAPLALLEAAHLTALRTGAACGLATDLLARKEAKIAAIFGAGFQARYQLEAIRAVRSLTKVYLYDPDYAKSQTFAEEISGKFGIEVEVASSPEEACQRAEIISTATTSSTPVFPDSAIKPGVHINAIGSYKPQVREVPSATVARAKIFVDQKEAALEEAGDLIIPLKEGMITEKAIVAEIGEVASGQKPGRTSAEEITFFKTVGLAAQDIALACRILETAERLNLGSKFEL